MNSFLRLLAPHLVAVATIIWSANTGAGLLVESTFDTGAEGWSIHTFRSDLPIEPPVIVLNQSPSYSSTGGNPSGYIHVGDLDSYWTVFSAPEVYLGDKSELMGGKLEFDIWASQNDGVPSTAAFIVGDSFTLWSVPSGPPSTVPWGQLSVDFVSSSWQFQNGAPASESDLANVLGDLQRLYISADWKTGEDLVGLDNVRIEAVPEPHVTVVCGAVGLLLLAVKRSKIA